MPVADRANALERIDAIARRGALGFAIDRALQALRVSKPKVALGSALALFHDAAPSISRNRFDEVLDLVTRDRNGQLLRCTKHSGLRTKRKFTGIVLQENPPHLALAVSAADTSP